MKVMRVIVRRQRTVKGMAWNHTGKDSQCLDIGHGNFLAVILSDFAM